MKSFPILIKKIREEAGLTQQQMAHSLGVSTILISMVETGQKEVSKGLVIKLAEGLGVHPSSLMPFLFTGNDFSSNDLSSLERKLVQLGEELQEHLIRVKSKKLKNYA